MKRIFYASKDWKDLSPETISTVDLPPIDFDHNEIIIYGDIEPIPEIELCLVDIENSVEVVSNCDKICFAE